MASTSALPQAAIVTPGAAPSAPAAPVDPLHALQAALQAAPGSPAQAEQLSALRASLDAVPARIPLLAGTLMGTLRGSSDSLLRRWVLDLLAHGLGRAPLGPDQRVQLAQQAFEALVPLLDETHPPTVKLVIQCFTGLYPVLFRWFCTNRHARPQWDALSQAKSRVLDILWAPAAPLGVKIAALKFAQRVIVVHTKGANDPRKMNDPNVSMCPTDHPFMNVPALEQEAMKLLQGVITLLYTSSDPDLLTAMLNSWAPLAKLRPGLTELVVRSLSEWTPANLSNPNPTTGARLPYSAIKSVEKAVRILLVHLSRTPTAVPFLPQITEALAQQGYRMDKAAEAERARRAGLSSQPSTSALPSVSSTPIPAPVPGTGPSVPFPVSDERKRPASLAPAATDTPPEKRQRLDEEVASADPERETRAWLASFDYTSLPASLVTDVVVSALQALGEGDLERLVEAYKAGRAPPPIIAGLAAAVAGGVAGVPAAVPMVPTIAAEAGPSAVKREPEAETEVADADVDALREAIPAGEIDTEEMEYEPDRLNEALGASRPGVDADDDDAEAEAEAEAEAKAKRTEGGVLDLSEFIPPPRSLEEEERTALVRKAFGRMWADAEEGDVVATRGGQVDGGTSPELWVLLIVRSITRTQTVRPASASSSTPDGDLVPKKEDGDEEADAEETTWVEAYERQDRMRQVLCDWIVADFAGRVRVASAWMNEEWYNDRLRKERDPQFRPNYETWLGQIVAAFHTHLDAKDRTFSRFLLDLPYVPPDVMALLRELCVEPERREVGFTTLRGFVTQRPKLRDEAMTALLDLTTHHDKLTRAAGINTVRRWVPDAVPMADMARDFALQLLRRLQGPPKSDGDGDADMDEEGQLQPEELVQTPYLPEQLTLPAERTEMLQHMEFVFALCVKTPDLLAEIFDAYGAMDSSVQEMLQELITPLIKSLGPSHAKLLMCLRQFPRGAEGLVLRVIRIFTENARPSAPLVALVKALVADRDLDVRFLVPIIAEMDKAEIVKNLPRVVATLADGTQESKNLVRSVFTSIVQTPSQTFGTVTSNLPRVRQSELLTPAELMVLLHESEKEVGLKPTIDAITICFSMTDVYRSDVLGAVMQQMVDQPTLPTLFMRTVIQALKTYKSLVSFVSTTLFNRLIIKKVWTNPPLWEGFIRCATSIAPASYAALLQLPKEQLRDIVTRQPSLKAGLREHVMKNARGNKARMAGYIDIFGEDPPAAGPGPGTNPPQAEPTQSS